MTDSSPNQPQTVESIFQVDQTGIAKSGCNTQKESWSAAVMKTLRIEDKWGGGGGGGGLPP